MHGSSFKSSVIDAERRAANKRKFSGVRTSSWSHEKELAGATGKFIALFLQTGSWITGKLASADKFTIKLEKVSIHGSPSADDLVIFKSALVGFRVSENQNN